MGETLMGEENTPPAEETPPPETKFTQEDVNRFLARERKKFEDELASRPTTEQVSDLEAKLTQLTHEQELRGKSEAEKLELRIQRENEKTSKQLQELQDQIQAKEQAVAEAQQTLRQERLSRAFAAALAKAEVYGPSATDALKVLLGEVKDVEMGDDGAIRASYGEDVIDDNPEVIARKFLEDRSYFATAKVGGAGTTPSNGRPAPKDIQSMSQDQLYDLAGPDPTARQ